MDKFKQFLINIISEAVCMGIKKYAHDKRCISFNFYNKCDGSGINTGRIDL